MKTHYTYLHCYPAGDPFYVGKGSGARAFMFEGRNPHHTHIIQKYGAQNILVYMFDCSSKDEAYADEKIQIAQLRAAGFILANQSNGGEGGWPRSATEIGSKRAVEVQREKSQGRFNSDLQSKWGVLGGTAAKERGIGFFGLSPEQRSENSRRVGRIVGAQRWKCAGCSMITAPGPLGMHQRMTGCSGKTRIQ